MTTAEEHQVPRHRKPGRAQRRGPAVAGRRVRNGPAEGCGCPPGFHEHGAHAPGAWPEADVASPPPGAYPVEDLAALTPGAAALLVHRAELETQAGAPAHRHLVIVHDPVTDEVEHLGPFRTGAEALAAARDRVDQLRDARPPRTASVTVTPLTAQ